MNIEERKGRKTFDVPDGYFDKFHERMMQQLPQERRATTRSIFPSRIVRLSYAAAIAILFIVGASFIYNNSMQTAGDDFDKEIIDDILNNYPIDDYTFYCYLTNNE